MDYKTFYGIEAFRRLQTNLALSGEEHPRSILVTSALRAEGKSTVCSHLAATMAQGERKILLMDADLRLPQQHLIFNQPNDEGLTTLAYDEPANLHLSNIGIRLRENLWLLPSGFLPPNPAEFLNSSGFRRLFAKLVQVFDVVLIDSPPIGLLTDPVILSHLADGTLLVVDPSVANKRQVQRAYESLERVHARIFGVVLNNVKPKDVESDGYGYGGYGQHKPLGSKRASR